MKKFTLLLTGILLLIFLTGCLKSHNVRWATRDGRYLLVVVPDNDTAFACGLREDGVLMWKYVKVETKKKQVLSTTPPKEVKKDEPT